MSRLAVVAAVACLALACGDDKKSAPAQQPAAKKPAPVEDEPAPAPDPAAQIPDEALPIAADFEDEADQNITADNYAATLDEIAEEIEAEPAQ